MNWLQKMSWRPKHEKDKKQIYLWHASPDKHNVLRSKSRMGKKDYSYRGLYFTQSFNSLIKDWIGYISGKKSKNKNEPNYTYKSLFVHKVSVPEWVLKESYKRQKEVFDIENRYGNASFGFWGWGQQVFIPEDLLDKLTLIDIHEYSMDDFSDMYMEYYKNRDNIIPSFNDPDYYWSGQFKNREQLIQKRKDEAKRRSQITVQEEIKNRKDNL